MADLAIDFGKSISVAALPIGTDGAASAAVREKADRTRRAGEAERELVRRAQAGEMAAYEELVQIHQPRGRFAAGVCEGVFFAAAVRSAFGIRHLALQDRGERMLGLSAQEEGPAAGV
jgi:hypothetical protein